MPVLMTDRKEEHQLALPLCRYCIEPVALHASWCVFNPDWSLEPDRQPDADNSESQAEFLR